MEGKQLDALLKEVFHVVLLRSYQNNCLIEVKKMIRDALKFAKEDATELTFGIAHELEALGYLVGTKEFSENVADHPHAASWLREIADELDSLSASTEGQA